MPSREALEDENRKLRRLRLLVDLVLARLYQDPELTLLEALDLVERCRDAALELFPGKEEAFELIYRPRFERVLAARWPHDMPEELGTEFRVDDPGRTTHGAG
ncbi:MAG TPA: hypothetical protein VJP59_02230 [Gemmatimonadota bacterium]|nr:hypothetical protein [Gemmatimonadota bacterium]